jgi:hypothetical protein
VAVNPSTFTVAPGASQDFTVTITRTTAALGQYATGSLTWSDGAHSVFSPIVVRSVAIAATSEAKGSGASGETSWTIRTGYAGELTYGVRGLVPATTTAGTVVDDPTDDFDSAHPDDNQGFTTHDVVVPANTVAARISLFDEFTDGADDLDLFVYRLEADGTKTFVGTSGSGTSAEQVDLANPTAATYRVYVHGWQTDGPDAEYTLFSWVLGSAAAGNMTANGPSPATIGGSGTVTVSWSGLAAGKYLGQVAYQQGTTTHGTTFVRVDVP